MENMDWVKDLKVGDEVAICHDSMWSRYVYSIEKVERITPTGRIILTNGKIYYPNGREMGESYSYPLRKVTPEILELIKRKKLIRQINFGKIEGLLNSERLEILLKWQNELLKECEQCTE